MEMILSKRDNTSLMESVFNRFYFVTSLAMLSVLACVFVDTAITGQFLGKDAVTAMGIVMPVTWVAQLIMSLFSSGCSQLCNRNIGKGDIGKVNSIFSTLACCAFVVGLIAGALLAVFASEIAWTLAPKAEPEVISLAAQYMRGYALSLLTGGLAMNLNGVMALDNDQKRCLLYAVTLLVADIILDLLNVLVFDFGILGMALATSLSNFLGFFVLLLHFRREKHILHFSTKNLDFSCVKEAVYIGFAQNLNIAISAVYSFIINNLLIYIGGSGLVAAFAVCISAYSLTTPVFMGLMTVTALVMSFSFGENNKQALIHILRTSFRMIYSIGWLILILFFVFANDISGLFLSSHNAEEFYQAGRFIQFYAVMMMFSIISHPVMGSLMGTANRDLNILLSILKEGIYPTLFTLLGGIMLGKVGIEIGLVLSGILTFMTCFAIPWVRNKKFPASVEDFLILPEEFDTAPSELFEAVMTSAEEVLRITRTAGQFCIERGCSVRVSNYVSMFIEEMASDTVRYGFDGKKVGRIELRIVLKKDHQSVSLRDNGNPFDPVKWLEVHNNLNPDEGIGIRMIVGIAKEVTCFRVMELNTLRVDLMELNTFRAGSRDSNLKIS